MKENGVNISGIPFFNVVSLLQFLFFTLGWIEAHHPGPPAATVWRSPRTSACCAREPTRQDSITGQPVGSPDSSQECPGAACQSSHYPAAGATATAKNSDCTTSSIVTAPAPAATFNPTTYSVLRAAGSDHGTRTKSRTKTFSTTENGTAATGERILQGGKKTNQTLHTFAVALSNHLHCLGPCFQFILLKWDGDSISPVEILL